MHDRKPTASTTITRTIKKERRTTFIERLAQSYVDAGLGEYEPVLKALQNREQSRADNRLIKSVLSPQRRKGLTRVTAPDPDDNTLRKEFTIKDEIEAACLRENIARFSQAHTTVCHTPAFQAAFGKHGEKPGVEQVVTGQIPPELQELPDTSFVKRFLPFLAQPEGLPDMEWTTSTEDYQQGWKKQKEKTSSGPGHVHFGHMMACARDDDISKFEAAFKLAPYGMGISPGTMAESCQRNDRKEREQLQCGDASDPDLNVTGIQPEHQEARPMDNAECRSLRSACPRTMRQPESNGSQRPDPPQSPHL